MTKGVPAKFRILLPAMVLINLWLPAKGLAEMYKWVDSAGQVHLTDNLFNVPQEYLSQIKTYQESRGPADEGDIPLVKSEAGYLLTARVNGLEEVRLILDTGATSTVISPQALKRAGVDAATGRRASLRTVGGEVKATAVEIKTISVGGFTRGPLTVVAHDAVPGYDGLLGMDFLGNYRFELLTHGPKLRLSTP